MGNLCNIEDDLENKFWKNKKQTKIIQFFK